MYAMHLFLTSIKYVFFFLSLFSLKLGFALAAEQHGTKLPRFRSD